MEKQKRFVSDDTLKALRNAGIIESDELVTITDCVVWFAERGVTIITDHNSLDNEWHTVACAGNDPKKWVNRRGNTSYIDAMNAAIRDAAEAYTELK